MDSQDLDQDSTRRRLPRDQRERLIVDEAVRFFAEVGFEGQTRALARRLGITQPLLYRYFPDKDALIDRVYREVFVDSWDPAWAEVLGDRTRPLPDRIATFYGRYIRVNFNYERVRLFMFAGLKDHPVATRYMAFVRGNLFVPLAREVRVAAGLTEGEPSAAEIECVAGLHGAIGYVGLRRWVYRAPVPEDVEAVIATLVTTFVNGAPAAFRAIEATQAPQ